MITEEILKQTSLALLVSMPSVRLHETRLPHVQIISRTDGRVETYSRSDGDRLF
jgi:hypothetical protein